MDIKALIDRQQALIDEMAAALQPRGVDATLAARPVAMEETRIAALEARVEALDQAKRDRVASIDASIATLKDDIAASQLRLESERKRLAPLLQASGTTPPKAAVGAAGKPSK